MLLIDHQTKELAATTARLEEDMKQAQWQAERTRVAFESTMELHQRLQNEQEE